MIVLWIENFTTKNLITRLNIVGLIGCAICIYNITIPLINHKYISKIESLVMEPYNIKDLSRLNAMISDKSFPLERRSMVSYSIAKDKYANSGDLTKFINEKGESRVYMPGKSEIERREQLVKSRIEALNSLKMARNGIYFQMIFWLSVFIFSIGFSLINRKKFS